MRFSNLPFVLLLISSLLGSCLPITYVPLPPANPMFTRKGQNSFQGGITTRYMQGMVASSPLKNISFSAGFSKAYPFVGNLMAAGLRAQYYTPLKRNETLFYHFSLAGGYAAFKNERVAQGGYEFSTEYLLKARGEYLDFGFATGIYWKQDEHALLALDFDYSRIRYSYLTFSRIPISGNLDRAVETNHSSVGSHPARTILSAFISLKRFSDNRRFFFKQSLGARFPINESVLLMENTPNSGLYGEWGPIDVSTPYILLSLHIGFNMQPKSSKIHP